MNVDYKITPSLAQRISADQAFHYRIVPKAEEDGTLVLRTDSQALKQLMEELQILLGFPVALEQVESDELQDYLAANYRIAKRDNRQLLHYTTDFLDKLVYHARDIGSSDIHFEPYEQRCRVRFRLDGKLVEYYSISLDEYPVIINKIKIKAELDIAEKRLPQDGRITMKAQSTEFDIRVSTLPTLFGEKIVLRILNRSTEDLELKDLGFEPEELARFQSSIQKPNGILLISGPTGSGKTTTLYATLKKLNNDQTNIITIEDPIEYTLEGINQVQLKEHIGLDFPSAMRTFLRQDPDIIMVGEIRDVKTANMAIRAALTGHLVLSTIHTNSAWGTISRLIDMGIPPFLIGTTLNGSVAQRLVRLLCDKCKRKTETAGMEKPIQANGLPMPEHHYEAVGCHQCHHTGYRGRRAIYEVLPITEELLPAIQQNVHTINAYLKEAGIATLKENAWKLFRDGRTSLEEIYPLLMD